VEPTIHYIKSGRSFGPVSARDFIDLVEGGVIGNAELVRIEGQTRWLPAGEVLSLLRSAPATSPTAAAAPTSVKPNFSRTPPGSRTVFTTAPPIPALRTPKDAELSCIRCSASHGLDASYCNQCGMRLIPQICGGCQRENAPDARFCEQCGQGLGAAPAG
jgi:ribosomal protein L40E